jgi:uncharacterized membrane protein YccC
VERTRPSLWRGFWQTVFRFQSEKINLWIGLRNAAGILIALAAGAASGNITAGVIGATGAINVAFRDSTAPYKQRARQMLVASCVAGLTVFAGGITGRFHILAILIAGLWAFAAGMLVAVSDAVADLGAMSVVILVIYAANPVAPRTAMLAGLAAFSGGLVQTLLSSASWPFRRYSPERRALADLFTALSRAALDPPAEPGMAPPATAHSLQAQTALASLGSDRSPEGDRYRFVLSQSERMRLSVVALGRIRIRLRREDPPPEQLATIDRVLELASKALESIADSLRSGEPAHSAEIDEMDVLAERLRGTGNTMLSDARVQADALAGQLRAAADVAGELPEKIAAPRRPSKAWQMRSGGMAATLVANLNLESAAFRHAVRMAACIVVGEGLARALGIPRPYWIPMTIAIVLKPDFGATFQRGVLRLGGTYAGLLAATILAREFPHATYGYILLIAALMFVVRAFGPANYAIVAGPVSAVVVFLISLTGIPAHQVIGARAINTSIGGAIALLAYWLWPTWERYRVAETAAKMFDSFRAYLQAIRGHGAAEQARVAGRLARSNLEASIGRASSEPGASAQSIALLNGMMASSRRLAQSLMSLEAAGFPDQPAFRTFADDVEFTLGALAGFLRGGERVALPDLREDHHELVRSGDRHALANIEADRIVNSLNTLTEQVLRWLDVVNVRH